MTDKEHPHTLAKLAALQARCDRLEDAIMVLAVRAKTGPDVFCELDKIIKGD